MTAYAGGGDRLSTGLSSLWPRSIYVSTNSFTILQEV